jgi:hypothetical protein
MPMQMSRYLKHHAVYEYLQRDQWVFNTVGKGKDENDSNERGQISKIQICSPSFGVLHTKYRYVMWTNSFYFSIS